MWISILKGKREIVEGERGQYESSAILCLRHFTDIQGEILNRQLYIQVWGSKEKYELEIHIEMSQACKS